MVFVSSIFNKYESIIFIMATGIVIRSIAEHIKNKKSDPAVIVIDEKGKFVISLLSGHLGGANKLSEEISEKIGATPVITTSSDLNNKTAVDMIAKKNDLIIDNMTHCKDITALLVNDKKVSIISKYKVKTPDYYSYSIEEADGAVIISNSESIEPSLPYVKLIPRNIVLGIGCKRDIESDHILSFIEEELKHLNIDKRSIQIISSIDVKSDETAILNAAESLNTELKFFSKDELNKVAHLFKSSEFVKKNVGTTSVSEASAYLAGNKNGKMLLGKKINNGATLSIFQKETGEIII